MRIPDIEAPADVQREAERLDSACHSLYEGFMLLEACISLCISLKRLFPTRMTLDQVHPELALSLQPISAPWCPIEMF